MRIILFSIILIILNACSSSFEYKEADKLIEALKKDNRIYRLSIHGNTIIINGQKTSSNKSEIEVLNKSGFNYEYERDYLSSIGVSKKELNSLLKQLENTGAYSVDYMHGMAYFMMESFLDTSNGYLFSINEIEISNENNKSKFNMNDGRINVLEKVKPKWYKVDVWH